MSMSPWIMYVLFQSSKLTVNPLRAAVIVPAEEDDEQPDGRKLIDRTYKKRKGKIKGKEQIKSHVSRKLYK